MVKPFVKDDVLPKLADLKDVRVKYSGRSDVAVAHPSGFVTSRTERDRGQEEGYTAAVGLLQPYLVVTLTASPRCGAP
jgi:hypothetical protein